jgi:hypothetical protein
VRDVTRHRPQLITLRQCCHLAQIQQDVQSRRTVLVLAQRGKVLADFVKDNRANTAGADELLGLLNTVRYRYPATRSCVRLSGSHPAQDPGMDEAPRHHHHEEHDDGKESIGRLGGRK